ncbi:MAG: hypothetical protein IJW25_01905, partial [Clostridia bacterium]|nr:hypothetical protein [Clostridia bacterium]
YTAEAQYSGTNFKMTGTTTYSYEIEKYTYNVADEGVTINPTPATKEYGTVTPTITQTFTKEFGNGATHTFTVTYTKEEGEDLGKYDLIYSSITSNNITFVVNAELLADKFEIVKNTSLVVTITITGGELVRYFGKANIGEINILDLTYTTTIGGQTVNAEISEGTIVYNTLEGTIGKYDAQQCQDVVSKNYTKFVIAESGNAQLEIKPRTVEITANNYNKEYDATNIFYGILSYNFNTNSDVEGVLSEDEIKVIENLAVITPVYKTTSVGVNELEYTLNDNFVGGLAQTTGEITIRTVTVTGYNTETYTYAGAKTIEVLADKLTAINLVDGHKLAGHISLNIDDAGEYDITTGNKANLIVVNNEINSNYKIVFADGLSKLIVEKANVTISAEKSFVFDETEDSGKTYTLAQLGATASGIIDGQTFVGSIVIPQDKYANNTEYSYTGESSNIALVGFDIKLNANSTLKNYNVEYNIVVRTTDQMTEDGIRATVKDSYTYNGKDQKTNISVFVEQGLSNTDNVKLNETGKLGKVVGFYTSRANAENNTSALTEVRTAGTYFVKVQIGSDYAYAKFEISKQDITENSLTFLDGTQYVGTKVYDATKTLEVSSTQICKNEADEKDSVNLLATYAQANVGEGIVVTITMSGEDSSNYNLVVISLTGKIESRIVTIKTYTDDAYSYAGKRTISISYSKLTTENLVAGHTLSGIVEVEVSNVGDYSIAEGTNKLDILSDGISVKSNYTFVFDSNLAKLKVVAALVTISWEKSENTYTYSAQEITSIPSNLTYSGNYTTGASSDIQLSFTYADNMGSASTDTTSVKYAGTYVIATATSASNNFSYTIDATLNTIVVNKKDISVNIGSQQIKYLQYMSDTASNTKGYYLQSDMITGAYSADKEYLEGSTYIINTTPRA